MPLPSVSNGARQCQVLTKRTKQQCKNPAAFGCKSCRMHGAHKSRTVPRGADHSQYRNAGETKMERAVRRKKSLMFQRLEEIGWHLGMFMGTKTRGRKVGTRLDLNDDNQLLIALIESIHDN